jgi:hypothetical protein
MIEAPDISEVALLRVLREDFGLDARSVVFMLVGNDARTFV